MTDLSAIETFRREVLAGLESAPKTLPCKYFYDPKGAALFIEICELEEYYPTRTETAILERRGAEIAAAAGPGHLVVELGSGEARKTEILLAALADPAGYVPVDISGKQLARTAERIDRRFPGLTVQPVEADYTAAWSLPELPAAERRLGFFPGSTIGNFSTREATSFLSHLCKLLGEGGALLIGADLQKRTGVSWSEPTTTLAASPPPSTSISWCESTASWMQTFVSTHSSTGRSIILKRAASRCISRANRHRRSTSAGRQSGLRPGR